MTINNLNQNEDIQKKELVITDEDREQIESQKENLIKIQSEKTEQKDIQDSQIDFLKKKLNQKMLLLNSIILMSNIL